MEELAALILEPLQQRFLSELGQILGAMEDNIQTLNTDLLHALQEVLDKSGHLQAITPKGAVAYISFSFLQSNLLLGKYAFQIDAYDERFLIDDYEASSEWDFSLLVQNLDQNFEAMARRLRQSVTRVQEYELWELQKAHQTNYYTTAAGVLQRLLPPCLDKLSFEETAVIPEVQFTIGPYMEKQTPFYQWRREP